MTVYSISAAVLGSFAKYASSTYGCSVVGINISPGQAKEAQKACKGLPVEVINCDYRDTATYLQNGKFDKVISAGMFEHVGYKNFRTYFEAAHRALKDDGMFLLHTGWFECFHHTQRSVVRQIHLPKWFVTVDQTNRRGLSKVCS